jgi:hypothetical protein
MHGTQTCHARGSMSLAGTFGDVHCLEIAASPVSRARTPLHVPGLGLATAGRFSLTREPAVLASPARTTQTPKGEG